MEAPLLRLRCLLPATVLLLLAGCSAHHFSRRPDAGSRDVPPDLKIVVGSGGGFAGTWNGYTICAPDSVFRWSGRRVGEAAAGVCTVDRDTLVSWWRDIKAEGIMQRTSVHANADFVQFISILAEGDTVDFSWPTSNVRDGAIAPLDALRARCMRAIQNAMNH